jgi:hypothetical protein
MSIIRLGTRNGRAKEIADAFRGSVALLAVLGAFVGALAVPVYFLAVFMAGLGWANWLNALCCAALAVAELYGLVLIPEYLDRRDDRHEWEEMQRPATATAARPQPAAKEREFAGAAERLSA